MERIKKYEPLWGKWTVKRKIGEGNFGAVYEVEKIDAEGKISSCAVKLIPIDHKKGLFNRMSPGETMSADKWEELRKKQVKKILREPELMESLQSRDHIVTIYDSEEHLGNETTDILIRMELLTNLNKYPWKKAGDSEEKIKEQVLKIGIELCKALEECEEENIVHCDIKPENIFINKSNTVKLGDFGIAHELAASSLVGSMGTYMYMAPEAAGYGEYIDYRSDIYSVGIVLYELLNDRKIPFAAEQIDYEDIEKAIARRMSGEKIEAPAHENGSIWKVIQKACQYKKEDRYQNAAEMRRALEKIKYGEKRQKEQLNYWKCYLYKKIFNQSEKDKKYKVGDNIFFGSYPQEMDGTEKAVEWTIMKKEGKKALLLSKYILDVKKYNEKKEDVTWETSDIRSWLNNEFYKTAFNNIEKEKIQTTLVKTEDNSAYGTRGGNDTEDKIFLLSIKEAKILFSNNKKRRARGTEYIRKSKSEVRWWLRSPGNNSYYYTIVKSSLIKKKTYRSSCAATVLRRGWVIEGGHDVDDCCVGVRPALWLNL